MLVVIFWSSINNIEFIQYKNIENGKGDVGLRIIHLLFLKMFSGCPLQCLAYGWGSVRYIYASSPFVLFFHNKQK